MSKLHKYESVILDSILVVKRDGTIQVYTKDWCRAYDTETINPCRYYYWDNTRCEYITGDDLTDDGDATKYINMIADEINERIYVFDSSRMSYHYRSCL